MIKKLVIALIAAVCLTGAKKEEAPTYTPELFNYACAYVDFWYNVQCNDLAAPVVVTSRIVNSRYYGLRHINEPYVFINKRLWLHDLPQWKTTVVHETVHYILDYAEAGFDRCESEEAARRAHHSFNKTKYKDNWRKTYKC